MTGTGLADSGGLSAKSFQQFSAAVFFLARPAPHARKAPFQAKRGEWCEAGDWRWARDRRTKDSCVRGQAPDARIYCGNLPPGAREEDVRSVFACFGSLRAVDVKAPAGVPPYAFVEFESVREAEDAVRERNGYEHEGAKLRVEFSKGGADRSRQAQRRSDYRIVISNLPQSGSWQDLKVRVQHPLVRARDAHTHCASQDACRDFGNVYYASVQRDGTGVVEFAHSSDMRRAVRTPAACAFTASWISTTT